VGKLRVFFRVNAIIICFLSLISFSRFVSAQGLDDSKSDIYSKLKCCSCKESFEGCTCPEAKEMKAYIDVLLESKVSRTDILYSVAKKFSLKIIMDMQIKAKIEQRLLKERGLKYSKIIFKPKVLKFGAKGRKISKVSKIVRLYNKGNINLVISNLRVSCDCVTVSLKSGENKSPYFGVLGVNLGWQSIIKPGNFGELEVVLDLSHQSMGTGKQIREVFVSSNDTTNPQADLRVDINILE
jgi:hypothetical protein